MTAHTRCILCGGMTIGLAELWKVPRSTFCVGTHEKVKILIDQKYENKTKTYVLIESLISHSSIF